MNKLELVKKYSPYIYFDEKEPFFPVKVGYFITNKSCKSPSSNRRIVLNKEDTDYAIEYEIYWDFDIQHLYELEHIWIYVGYDGKIVDAEGSSHGGMLKALLRDRSNILDETHIKVFSQPGKHAFCPLEGYFELIPNVCKVTNELAGKDGLLVADIFEAHLRTNNNINKCVKMHIQGYRFEPAFQYKEYRIPEDYYVTWNELKKKIPYLVESKLRELGYTGKTPVIPKKIVK